MFKFLLIVQTLVAASLVSVILMQRSEGGGLGVGGSSSGFMTARGAADFLTRSTAVLGGLFVILSITLAAIAGTARQPMQVDTSLANRMGTAPATAPANEQQPAAPTQNESAPAVPLAQ
jgi:preprotein translocase subunit SecG